MTAFGRASLKSDTGEFICELRSVNHRYLDVSVRLPEALRSLELKLRERVSATLNRGKIEVSIKIDTQTAANRPFVVNSNLLSQIVSAVDEVNSLTQSNVGVDPLRVLQWPGVMNTSDDTLEDIFKDALIVFDQALSDFVATGEREGAQIAELFTGKSQYIREHVNIVRKARPAVIAKQKEKWLAKLAQLDTDHDVTRLEQELVYAAQRLDIDEELDRLEAHCIEIAEAIKRTEPVGRRLDFLMQELNREANTLASKAGDIDTTNASVDIKVLIEQIREQVQNVE